MIVTAPFFPEPPSEEVKKFKEFWGEKTESKEDSINWYGYSSADATQVLFPAISTLIKEGKTPTRELIRDEISKPNFKTEGLTGKVSFKGSDRAQQVNYLIQLNCSKNFNCSWKSKNILNKGQ